MPSSHEELKALIDKNSIEEGFHGTAIDPVHLIKYYSVNSTMPVVYNPSLCLIVQGEKKVTVDSEMLVYAPSQFLAVSIDMPVVGEVTKASKAEPYLCLQLDIDPSMVGDLIAQMGLEFAAPPQTSRAIFVGNVDEPLLESVVRLARLLDTPRDIPMLGPMAIREVYYRVLSGPHGAAFAQIAVNGSNVQRIANAITMLRTNFHKPMRVEEMAAAASMSPSSFHHHFKEVTAMSPLQYQKKVRLLEARRILLSEVSDAASTAYRVGYESASQFSREYSRMFGAPPIADREGLRAVQGL